MSHDAEIVKGQTSGVQGQGRIHGLGLMDQTETKSFDQFVGQKNQACGVQKRIVSPGAMVIANGCGVYLRQSPSFGQPVADGGVVETDLFFRPGNRAGPGTGVG